MRTLSGLLMSLVVGAECACAAPPPAPNHPILGIWTLTLPDIGCHEVYRFRGDGTTLVTSAGEVSESEFQIPASPSEKGFYKLEDKVTRDNGKKDCAGVVMKAGKRNTNFIRFHPSGVLFLMCADESMEACIGPFERVLGKST